MNKRGQGMQFNWIFVIVAGAIILGFFVMFTFIYVGLQEMRENVRVAKLFSTSLDVLEKSPAGDYGYVIDNTADEAFRAGIKIKMDYFCSGEDANLIINEDERSEQELRDQVLFAPRIMRINALDTWIFPWYFPFHVSNFIYLSPPDMNYYVVYDFSTEEFVENLEFVNRPEFKVTMTNNVKDIKEGVNGKVIFIRAVKPQSSVVNSVKKKFEKVSVSYVNPLSGDVIFFEEKEKKSEFYGEPLLYGVVFSDNYEMYECGLQRALKRLESVSRVYLQKLSILNQVDQTPGCFYSGMQQTLNNFVKGDYNLVDNLEEQNKELYGKGCLNVF